MLFIYLFNFLLVSSHLSTAHTPFDSYSTGLLMPEICNRSQSFSMSKPQFQPLKLDVTYLQLMKPHAV